MNDNNQANGKKYRILIVDDHPIVRRGLRELVADEPDLEVCGEAEDVAQALDQVASARPDLAIVDLTLKNGHGLDLIQEIKARHGQVKMLVSSMHDESLLPNAPCGPVPPAISANRNHPRR
jgi:DNA-binding NarL/FixJ family response regulator